MQLTDAQRHHLFTQGYVRIEGVIPQVLIDRALSAINHNIGTAGLPPDKLSHFGYRSFCPEITGTPDIIDLFNRTPARSLICSALGDENCIPEVAGAQIAIRFPRHTPKMPGTPKPHIDGFNEAAEGKFQHFTALCGIVLSDTSPEHSGRFTVWPGSHHVAEAHFAEHGMTREYDFVPPLGDIEALPLAAKPGDVIFTHYQLAHTAGPNLSPHPRYALFFRLKKTGHRHDDLSYFTDIWQEWDGMRDVIAAHADHANVAP